MTTDARTTLAEVRKELVERAACGFFESNDTPAHLHCHVSDEYAERLVEEFAAALRAPVEAAEPVAWKIEMPPEEGETEWVHRDWTTDRRTVEIYGRRGYRAIPLFASAPAAAPAEPRHVGPPTRDEIDAAVAHYEGPMDWSDDTKGAEEDAVAWLRAWCRVRDSDFARPADPEPAAPSLDSLEIENEYTKWMLGNPGLEGERTHPWTAFAEGFRRGYRFCAPSLDAELREYERRKLAYTEAMIERMEACVCKNLSGDCDFCREYPTAHDDAVAAEEAAEAALDEWVAARLRAPDGHDDWQRQMEAEITHNHSRLLTEPQLGMLADALDNLEAGEHQDIEHARRVLLRLYSNLNKTPTMKQQRAPDGVRELEEEMTSEMVEEGVRALEATTRHGEILVSEDYLVKRIYAAVRAAAPPEAPQGAEEVPDWRELAWELYAASAWPGSKRHEDALHAVAEAVGREGAEAEARALTGGGENG